jgi:flagellar biosynthesis protein FlhG
MLRVIDGGAAPSRTRSPSTMPPPRRARAVAVTGGKGGTGKSTIALNLAIAWAERSARPLLVDTDLGMADLNLLLGVAPARGLLDVLAGTPVEEALVAAHGIHLLPALNGSYALATIGAAARRRAFTAIESLAGRFDTLVVDVAAGIGPNQTAFAGAVPEALLVATPEPLSVADAYACLKVLSLEQGLRHAYVVPNRVTSSAEADDIVGRLDALVRRFLDVQLTALPAIPLDPAVGHAAELGVPLLVHRPDSPAARGLRQVARALDAIAVPVHPGRTARLSWRPPVDDWHGNQGERP